MSILRPFLLVCLGLGSVAFAQTAPTPEVAQETARQGQILLVLPFDNAATQPAQPGMDSRSGGLDSEQPVCFSWICPYEPC